jgi:hypothetical protein
MILLYPINHGLISMGLFQHVLHIRRSLAYENNNVPTSGICGPNSILQNGICVPITPPPPITCPPRAILQNGVCVPSNNSTNPAPGS